MKVYPIMRPLHAGEFKVEIGLTHKAKSPIFWSFSLSYHVAVVTLRKICRHVPVFFAQFRCCFQFLGIVDKGWGKTPCRNNDVLEKGLSYHENATQFRRGHLN